MNLDKLYKMQEELDDYIWGKHKVKEKMTEEELLNNTLLALLVEVGELANTTRCFKHWSTKGMMDKETVLDELADVIHFYLSIGNQLRAKYSHQDNWKYSHDITLIGLFNKVFTMTSNLTEVGIEGTPCYKHDYKFIGLLLKTLWQELGFTNTEVEKAYMKKHEENYRRQKEGY